MADEEEEYEEEEEEEEEEEGEEEEEEGEGKEEEGKAAEQKKQTADEENEEDQVVMRKCSCGFDRPHIVNQGFLTEEQLAELRGTKKNQCNGFCPIHKTRKILDVKTAIRSEKVHMNECLDCRAEHDELIMLKSRTMKEWTCLICGKGGNFAPTCRVCDAITGREPSEGIVDFESPNAGWFAKRAVPEPDEEDDDGATNLVHPSWQYQAIEAIRLGDPVKLEQAFYDDEKTNINLVSQGGGWGGYRFPSWTRHMYGGHPDGESLLHLAMRVDNQEKTYGFNVAYPRRYEIAKTLYELDIDFSIRSAYDRIARDQNKVICDAVYPPSKWDNKMVLGWLLSRGRSLKHRDKWVDLFQLLQVDGDKLMSLGRKENFEHWFAENLANLTKLGVPSGDLEREVMVLYRILNQVVRDAREGSILANAEEKKIWLANGGAERAATLKAEREAVAEGDDEDDDDDGDENKEGKVEQEQEQGEKLPPI